MGNTTSDLRDQCTIMLCQGHHSNFYYSIDVDPKTHPDRVGDVRYAHHYFPDHSLSTLVFQFCPTYVFRSPTLTHWFRKIKVGGKVIIHGHAYHDTINISKDSHAKHWVSFRDIIQSQLKQVPFTFRIREDVSSRRWDSVPSSTSDIQPSAASITLVRST